MSKEKHMEQGFRKTARQIIAKRDALKREDFETSEDYTDARSNVVADGWDEIKKKHGTEKLKVYARYIRYDATIKNKKCVATANAALEERC